MWHALSAQLAKMEKKVPLSDGSCTEDGHPAPCPVSTHMIRSAVTSTLSAVNPQPAIPIPSRRQPSQNTLSNPVLDLQSAAGSSRDHQAGDPKVMAAGHPGYVPGLHLLKPVREALSTEQLLAKPPQNPEPRHMDHTFQEKKKASCR